MRGDGSNLIRDRKYHLHSYSSCFVGQEFVDWLVKKGEAQNRKEAVEIGMQLVDAGVIRHGMPPDSIIKTAIIFFFSGFSVGYCINGEEGYLLST